jgi:hypothetical protein
MLPDSLHLLSYITGLELHLGRHGNKPVLTVATKNILLIKYKKFYSLVYTYDIKCRLCHSIIPVKQIESFFYK